ncbi:MAG: hypothetical protein GXN98_00500 [Euryarchaeota archaeon]|nr:hypothetical protein [Euryarchaeota archaeon]
MHVCAGGEYEERAPLSRGILALIAVGGGVLITAVLLSLAGAVQLPPGVAVGGAAVLLLALGSFASMRFRLTESELEARMFPVSYRVRYGDIERVELGEVPWYAGWGLRVLGRKLAFVSRHGKAVWIKRRGDGVFREVIVTPREPERFAEMLMRRVRGEKA